jgi:LmbE family N-acetylglucosaminyl deacetylase
LISIRLPALAGLWLWCAGTLAAPAPTLPLSDLAAISSRDALLVVAPHPDDESLCCAGLIQRAHAVGAKVGIVWLTSGDAFELDAGLVEHTLRPGQTGLRQLAIQRMEEARVAARTLQVPPDRLYFLGFPDRGLLPLLLDYFYVPYTSPHTGLAAVSYPGALAPGASYEGRNLQRGLTTVLDALKPTFVLAPSPLDAHPDHRAAGDLVIRTLGERQQLDRIRYWIVHGGTLWPAPRGLHPDAALVPPKGLSGMQWESVPLEPSERDAKLEALRRYHTQMFGLETRFLVSFVRRNEIYARRPLPVTLPAPQMSAPEQPEP